jgi:hypothetical protein
VNDVSFVEVIRSRVCYIQKDGLAVGVIVLENTINLLVTFVQSLSQTVILYSMFFLLLDALLDLNFEVLGLSGGLESHCVLTRGSVDPTCS